MAIRKINYHEKHQLTKSRQEVGGEEGNNGNTIQPENNNMALISPYISIITLNINGLDSSVIKYRVAGWIKNKTQLYTAYKGFTSALWTILD